MSLRVHEYGRILLTLIMPFTVLGRMRATAESRDGYGMEFVGCIGLVKIDAGSSYCS